jgi:hypothetical protein
MTHLRGGGAPDAPLGWRPRVYVPVQRTRKLELAFEQGAPPARTAVPLPPAR